MRLMKEPWFRRSLLLFVLSLVLQSILLGAIFFQASKNGFDPILMSGDSASYTVTTENLFTHGTLSYAKKPPYVPDSVRTPGYPFFLGLLWKLTGQHWVAVLIIQSAILALAPSLLYLITRRLHETAAFAASIVFALEPTRLFYSTIIMSDGFFVFALLLVLLAFLQWVPEARPKRMLFVGLGIGFLVLIRPIAMLVWIPFLAGCLLSTHTLKRKLISCALILLGCAAVVLPWSARNAYHFDSWQLSPIGSFSFAFANASLFWQQRSGMPLSEIREAFESSFPPGTPQEDTVSLKHMDVYARFTSEAIGGQWFSYLTFHAIKSIPLFITDSFRGPLQAMNIIPLDAYVPNFSSAFLHGNLVGEWKAYVAKQPFAASCLIIGMLFWIVVWILAAAALWRYRASFLNERTRLALWMMLLLTGYFLVLASGPVAQARYRLPAEGFVLFFTILVLMKKPLEESRKT